MFEAAGGRSHRLLEGVASAPVFGRVGRGGELELDNAPDDRGNRGLNEGHETKGSLQEGVRTRRDCRGPILMETRSRGCLEKMGE